MVGVPSDVETQLSSWADTQHQNVVHRDGAGHIQRLFAPIGESSWQRSDLTADLGAPLAAARTPLTGGTDFPSAPHNLSVVYIESGGDVYQLYRLGETGPWGKGDLVAATGAPPAAAGSPLVSEFLRRGREARYAAYAVYYLDQAGAVHRLGLPDNNYGWYHSSPTAACGAPPAAAGSSMTHWRREPGIPHFAYVIQNGGVHVVYSYGGWKTENLTFTARAQIAAPRSALTSWADSKYQHVVHIDRTGHVQELYAEFAPGKFAPSEPWQVNDITAATGAPSPARGSALSSWFDANYQHVVYFDGAGNVQELYFPLKSGAAWWVNNLTAATGAPPAAPGSALSSWVDANYQHVIHLDTAGHIHELYYGLTGASTWRTRDLTAATSG